MKHRSSISIFASTSIQAHLSHLNMVNFVASRHYTVCSLVEASWFDWEVGIGKWELGSGKACMALWHCARQSVAHPPCTCKVPLYLHEPKPVLKQCIYTCTLTNLYFHVAVVFTPHNVQPDLRSFIFGYAKLFLLAYKWSGGEDLWRLTLVYSFP
jgi:hypothetical protein